MSFNIPFVPTDAPNPLLGPRGLTLVRGDNTPQLQLQEVVFDPVRGYVYKYNWKGASQDKMQPVWQECVSAGMACSLRFERDTGILEVTDSTSQSTIDSWEIHATEETRDQFSHPAIVAAVSDLTPVDDDPVEYSIYVFTALRGHIAANDPWPTVADDSHLALVIANPAATAIVKEFYMLYFLGTTGYRRQAYVLKHKTNVSNRYQANVSDIGVDKVYTPAQMLGEVSNPYFWTFPLPDRLQYKLGAIIPEVAPGNYLWGWLKSSSTETTDALNRVQIETDYTLDLWNVYLYPVFTG